MKGGTDFFFFFGKRELSAVCRLGVWVLSGWFPRRHLEGSIRCIWLQVLGTCKPYYRYYSNMYLVLVVNQLPDILTARPAAQESQYYWSIISTVHTLLICQSNGKSSQIGFYGIVCTI